MAPWRGVIEEYRTRLPVRAGTPLVSLGEGGTPLVLSRVLSKRTDCEVYLKYEGTNPTGSFKDRGMTLAVSLALEEGARAIVCASTGNTSASAAAYAARAGVTCAVLIPKGNVALGKLAQALAHGALVVEVNGNFDDALEVTRKLQHAYAVTVVNSINPHRIEGQKTAAFEVCDVLGRAPQYHFIPVGNAGNITAYWKGYREYWAEGIVDSTPAMFGIQAEGAAPIVKGHPVDPKTIATAIRIGNPASWEGAVTAATDSGGEIFAVRDKEILETYRMLSREEGLFAELASAASVAGLLQAYQRGVVKEGSVVVCVLTGHGLKDPQWAIAGAPKPLVVPPEPAAVAEALGLE